MNKLSLFELKQKFSGSPRAQPHFVLVKERFSELFGTRKNDNVNGP